MRDRVGDLDEAVAAARAGDELGFARLWRAHQPGLLRYLRVLVGGAAEDVASETWLHVARHRAIDDRRWVRRRPEELVEPAGVPEVGTADAWAEAAEHLDTEWALAVIGTLPRNQAEAVLLRVVVGLDVAGTAKVLGKRPGAVRVAALRGLRRLAEHAEVQRRRTSAPPVGVTPTAAATPRSLRCELPGPVPPGG